MYFFFLSISILPKEQLRKRQQVDLLLGQMRMEGKDDYRLAGVRRAGGAGSFDRGLSSE